MTGTGPLPSRGAAGPCRLGGAHEPDSRRAPPQVLGEDLGRASERETAGRLADALRWLVRLRWVAVAGLAVAVSLPAAAGSISALAPLAALVAGLAATNVWFARRAGRLTSDLPAARLHREVELQIVCDLLWLTATLRWSGGVDNPFATFYVFPMALAAMLLPQGRALRLGVVAIALHSLELLGTASGLLPHIPTAFIPSHLHAALLEPESWRSGMFIAGYLVSFSATQFGILYLVGAIARRQREAEERRIEHDRVACSLKRMARVGTVASGVAHAVRNPLHGLVNCVDILRQQGTDDELLELMDEGVRRIERITQRLLILGREGPLERVPTALDELADDAIRLVRAAGRTRGVSLSLKTEGQARASVDPDRLGEAVVNLLDNAVHASPEGGVVTVRVATTPTEAVLEVADQGPGIPPDVRERVFDPFFTTKAVGEGTGLGLAITRTVVRAHGGRVTIQPATPRGTMVRLVLPREGSGGVA